MATVMKSSNPAFGRNTFEASAIHVGYGASMTVSGTVNKAGILLLCVMATAAYSWSQFFGARETGDMGSIGGLATVGFLGGFVLAMVTIFKQSWSPVTAPIYALFEGLGLGALSAVLELRYPGIAIEAVALTFGTCLCMLAAYRAGLVRPTEKFRTGIIAATGGIALLYFATFILSIFHIQIPGIFGSAPIGIIFSLVVCGVAALNLILDFGSIEDGAMRGAPKYMEWYSAFGLMLTLVWLYLEIIRLLSKLRDNER